MPSHEKNQAQRLKTLISNLTADFSLDTLSKSPARFNLDKLNWFNKEYIKMMSLEEFAYRASKLKLETVYPEKKLRVGDYAFLVDIEEQKVFCNKTPVPVFGGNYYLVGGGRKIEETWQQNLVREIAEETYNKIQIQLDKVIKICDFQTLKSFNYPGEGEYDGRHINIYFYPCKESEISKYTLEDVGTFVFEWYDLAEVIANHPYLNYPIWKNFCEQNNLVCFEPTTKILDQCLAWMLDKNRVTTLSEVG